MFLLFRNSECEHLEAQACCKLLEILPISQGSVVTVTEADKIKNIIARFLRMFSVKFY